MKLLNVPISPFGMKVQLALLEKGVAFELREPDLETAQAGDDDELTSSASPRLEIPLLIDGDVTIFDSTIILEYLEERWPEPPLLPPTPAARARARMIEDICDTTYEAAVWGVYEVAMMGRVHGEQQATLLARGGEQIAGLNAWLGRELSDREWLTGDGLGWADVSAFPVVHFADRLGHAPEGPLAAWLDRMRSRPSVAQVSDALVAWFETPLNRPTDTAGTWKRLYKAHRLEWMIRSGGLDVVVAGVRDDNVRFSRELS